MQVSGLGPPYLWSAEILRSVAGNQLRDTEAAKREREREREREKERVERGEREKVKRENDG